MNTEVDKLPVCVLGSNAAGQNGELQRAATLKNITGTESQLQDFGGIRALQAAANLAGGVVLEDS